MDTSIAYHAIEIFMCMSVIATEQTDYIVVGRCVIVWSLRHNSVDFDRDGRMMLAVEYCQRYSIGRITRVRCNRREFQGRESCVSDMFV